ncbi:hypothetical protein P7C71_g3969, partial [Lecanoromycetidae sp. Uapishka_2]
MTKLQKKQAKRPSTPPSTPLLLSTGGGQDSVHSDARRPGKYTVSERLNLIRSGSVTLPVERQLTPEEATVPGFPIDYSSFIDAMRRTHGSGRPVQAEAKPKRESSSPSSGLFTPRSSGSIRTRGSSRPVSEALTSPPRSPGSTRRRESVNRLLAKLHIEASLSTGSTITEADTSPADAASRAANFAARNTAQYSNASSGSTRRRGSDRADLEARTSALRSLDETVTNTEDLVDPVTEGPVAAVHSTAHHPNLNHGFIVPRATGVPEIEMTYARRLVENDPPVGARLFKWDNDEFVDMMGENHPLAEKRRARLARNAAKKVAKERPRAPSGWTPETPKTTSFHRFMELKDMQHLHPGLMKYMMKFMLVLRNEDIVPYHYVKGKVLKDVHGGPGKIRGKPNTNLLIALASSINTKGRMILDDAQNILFRNNRFSFRNPRELIMFMDAIGSANMLRMQNGKNLVVKRTFFSTKYQNTFEMKWLARWAIEMRSQMLGLMVVTPDWDVSQEDLEYEGPKIERQLKVVVQALKEANEMESLLGKSPTVTPMRIRSLDLGEAFSRVTDSLGQIDVAANTNSQDGEGIENSEGEESNKGKGRVKIDNSDDEVNSKARIDKGKGRAETPDLDYDDNELSGRLGEWYLDHTMPGTLWDGSFMDDDDDSVESGWCSPSNKDECDPARNAPGYGEDKIVHDDGDFTWSDDEINRRLAEVMARH